MNDGASRPPAAWEGYRDLFAEVQRGRKWSRTQMVDALNDDARAHGKPKCTYSKRATEYWETEPTPGKRWSQPRGYRSAHLYDWLARQMGELGEAERHAANLTAIKPRQAPRVLGDPRMQHPGSTQSVPQQRGSAGTQSAPQNRRSEERESSAFDPTARAEIRRVDERLLSDYLTGLGYAEWMGSVDQWELTVRNGREWLMAHPDDVFCRAMLLWSVVNRGNPLQMIAALDETARWLMSDAPIPPIPASGFRPGTWQCSLAEKIHTLTHDRVDHAGFVRWYFEDTLVRAAFLRWLKSQGNSSQLAQEFGRLGRDLEQQPVMTELFDATATERGNQWVATAVECAARWASFNPESGLARLCWLWFIGREELPDRMHFVLDQTSRWLERNPHHTLTRWATIWLAGHCPEGERIINLIDESARWLQTREGQTDRLVRMTFLWLVGARGSPAQVTRTIAQTNRWLRAHVDDDFIGIAHLLHLVRRRGTPPQRREAVSRIRKWLDHHEDGYGLTELALLLGEAPAA